MNVYFVSDKRGFDSLKRVLVHLLVAGIQEVTFLFNILGKLSIVNTFLFQVLKQLLSIKVM